MRCLTAAGRLLGRMCRCVEVAVADGDGDGDGEADEADEAARPRGPENKSDGIERLLTEPMHT